MGGGRLTGGGECQLPENVNLSLPTRPWKRDVKYPYPLCRPDITPPKVYHLPDINHSHDTVVAYPSLFVPCCAHSGTTFLWRCMLYAFHPELVCANVKKDLGRASPYIDLAHREYQWRRSQCGERRYLLPGLAGNIQGGHDYRKEYFFFGGGGNQFARGWQWYRGIHHPICWWERKFIHTVLTDQPLDNLHADLRKSCIVNEHVGHSWRKCTHQTCLPIDLNVTRLAPKYAPQYDASKPRFRFQVLLCATCHCHCCFCVRF